MQCNSPHVQFVACTLSTHYRWLLCCCQGISEMVACHGSQEERSKLWMNTWTDLNELCENVHDCDIRNYPPKVWITIWALESIMMPTSVHPNSKSVRAHSSLQFLRVWHILGGPAHTCKNALVQKRAYYTCMWAQPCQNVLKGKLIQFPLLACMVEVWQLLYIGEA